MHRYFLRVFVLGLALTSTPQLSAAELNVFAAASLTESLKAIAANYEKQTGDKVVCNFGASSVLARQIEEGAPADVFFSADEAKMNALAKKDLILPETRKSRLSNALVIIAATDGSIPIHSANDLTNETIQHVALADPKGVPAGIYAKEYLTSVKLWPAIAPKVVPTENVRGALAAVESGNAEAGMVYKTDAAISSKVKIVFEVPAKEAPVISYPMAVVKDSKQPDAAKKFLQYLNSDESAKVFRQFGFIVRR